MPCALPWLQAGRWLAWIAQPASEREDMVGCVRWATNLHCGAPRALETLRCGRDLHHPRALRHTALHGNRLSAPTLIPLPAQRSVGKRSTRVNDSRKVPLQAPLSQFFTARIFLALGIAYLRNSSKLSRLHQNPPRECGSAHGAVELDDVLGQAHESRAACQPACCEGVGRFARIAHWQKFFQICHHYGAARSASQSPPLRHGWKGASQM